MEWFKFFVKLLKTKFKFFSFNKIISKFQSKNKLNLHTILNTIKSYQKILKLPLSFEIIS